LPILFFVLLIFLFYFKVQDELIFYHSLERVMGIKHSWRQTLDPSSDDIVLQDILGKKHLTGMKSMIGKLTTHRFIYFFIQTLIN